MYSDVQIERYTSTPEVLDARLRFRTVTTDFIAEATFVRFDPELDLETSGLDSSNYENGGQTMLTEDVEEEGVSVLLDDRNRRIREFERHLSSEPGDASAWLAYAGYSHHRNHQDHRSELEVTLAILDRALKNVPSIDCVPIILERLAIVEELWKALRVEATWRESLDEMEQTIAKHASAVSSMMSLWNAYLDWTEGSAFGRNGRGVDDVVAGYEEVFVRTSRYSQSHLAARPTEG